MARPIRIAAAGDIHCSPESRERVEEAFARIAGVDLILLAGDLTTHGEPDQAAVLADRKSTRLNSSHTVISYAVFCLKKKNQNNALQRRLSEHEREATDHANHPTPAAPRPNEHSKRRIRSTDEQQGSYTIQQANTTTP